MTKFIRILRRLRNAVERYVRKGEFERVFYFRPDEASLNNPAAVSTVRIKLRILGREWCEAWDFLYEAISARSEAEFGRRTVHDQALKRFKSAIRLANLFGFGEAASHEGSICTAAISLMPSERDRFWSLVAREAG